MLSCVYWFVLSWTTYTSEWRIMSFRHQDAYTHQSPAQCLGYTLQMPRIAPAAFSSEIRFSQFQIFTLAFSVGSQQTVPLMWWKSQLTSWSLKTALQYKPITYPCFSSLSAALGQIMLYVDGMNGVINHSETIQWLYTLVGSKVRQGFFFLFLFGTSCSFCKLLPFCLNPLWNVIAKSNPLQLCSSPVLV